MVAVEVQNRSGWELDERAAGRVLAAALAAEGVAEGEAAVLAVAEAEMAELNARHRGTAAATDVLSFPLDGRAPLPAGVPRQLGDIVVCPAVARRDGTPLAALLVHGALHLLGYDHEVDGGEMLRRQEALVAEVEAVAARPS